ELRPFGARLIAVSKTRAPEDVKEAYAAGQRLFGENYVQELSEKRDLLPVDIQWHFIGHLQSNKVKFLSPFVSCIQTIDSHKLLMEIDRQAQRSGRVIDCLLQIHIAQESTKFGFTFDEARKLMEDQQLQACQNIRVAGVMGMATNTEEEDMIRSEFRLLRSFFEELKIGRPDFREVSMGMSGDYRIALEEGSTLVRIGSAIFGERKPKG
ncbi:MAG: YggS family pyridoxal phosphate-dependent enzyme, partial [Flavobacteriales bacterium]